jgi:hypothetical protein
VSGYQHTHNELVAACYALRLLASYGGSPLFISRELGQRAKARRPIDLIIPGAAGAAPSVPSPG